MTSYQTSSNLKCQLPTHVLSKDIRRQSNYIQVFLKLAGQLNRYRIGGAVNCEFSKEDFPPTKLSEFYKTEMPSFHICSLLIYEEKIKLY